MCNQEFNFGEFSLLCLFPLWHLSKVSELGFFYWLHLQQNCDILQLWWKRRLCWNLLLPRGRRPPCHWRCRADPENSSAIHHLTEHCSLSDSIWERATVPHMHIQHHITSPDTRYQIPDTRYQIPDTRYPSYLIPLIAPRWRYIHLRYYLRSLLGWTNNEVHTYLLNSQWTFGIIISAGPGVKSGSTCEEWSRYTSS